MRPPFSVRSCSFGRSARTEGFLDKVIGPKAFDEAAFALKPGEVSEVIQTEYGFHIIKVAKHEPARARTLAEATPQIHERLMTMRQAATLAGWLKETRRKAAIHINEPFRFGALRTEFPAN